jgi:hypothetical protein
MNAFSIANSRGNLHFVSSSMRSQENTARASHQPTQREVNPGANGWLLRQRFVYDAFMLDSMAMRISMA